MNEISRELVKKIDAEIEELSKNNPNFKVAEAAQPFIRKFAEEAGIDEIDLFVDYMDHVALSSKRVAQSSEGEMIFSEEELDKDSFKLY